jgi:hypothetical protein
MKWGRAVHHVESLAQSCAEMSDKPFFSLTVTQLWAVGDILGPQQDLESVTVALVVDLPPDDVAWWTEPRGAQHWADGTRLSKNPVLAWWRSAKAPVWNHRIVRPALVWDAAEGLREHVLNALREGRGESVRTVPPSDMEYAARLHDELAVSRKALAAATTAYEQRRWSPAKLEPIADALWRASDGYLDVLACV